MNDRHNITSSMETVLSVLSDELKTVYEVWEDTTGMQNAPATVGSTHANLLSLRRAGYATDRHIYGQCYWFITKDGLQFMRSSRRG